MGTSLEALGFSVGERRSGGSWRLAAELRGEREQHDGRDWLGGVDR